MCRTSFFKKPSYCTCGVYIRVNNVAEKSSHFAFVDICQINSFDIDKDLKFRYYNTSTHQSQTYVDLNCTIEILNEDSDSEWSKVPVSQNYFKCAKLRSDYCISYVVSKLNPFQF